MSNVLVSTPQDAVIVPQLTHQTVQNILEINKNLIKIMVEYQNNGWIEEPEFKMYVCTVAFPV